MVIRIVFYVNITILPILINYYIKKYCNCLKIIITYDNNNYYNHLFITPRNKRCKEHIFNQTECSNYCSYSYIHKIRNFIASSKKSISICLYTLTISELFDELVKAYNRGVNIRIITDLVMVNMEPSKLQRLKNIYGVTVKTPTSKTNLMHHKFCLVDECDSRTAKMLMGSLNMTLQGFSLNFDFSVLTNNAEWIRRYSQEFEDLWDTFD